MSLLSKGKQQKRWHKYTVVCPKCSNSVIVKDIAFTSSGEIRVVGSCDHCKIEVFCEMEIVNIMMSCARSEKEGKKLMIEKTAASKELIN